LQVGYRHFRFFFCLILGEAGRQDLGFKE